MSKCRCNKLLYNSLFGAVKACVKMKAKYGREFYHYRCGNGYHVTRQRNSHSGLIKGEQK